MGHQKEYRAVHTISLNYHEYCAVLNGTLTDLEFEKNSYDLWIQIGKEKSLLIVYQGYFFDLHERDNFTTYLYNNNAYIKLDLQRTTENLQNVSSDEFDIIKDYTVNFRKTEEIELNVNGTEELGIMIIEEVDPNDISIHKQKTDLLLKHKNLNFTLSLKGWCSTKQNRIDTWALTQIRQK